jgi:hypothetical protein
MRTSGRTASALWNDTGDMWICPEKIIIRAQQVLEKWTSSARCAQAGNLGMAIAYVDSAGTTHQQFLMSPNHRH